ncbi:MAG: hypothetical protein L0219_02330 [Phycisphaerales bacterium]|nr:hypothetical protein [Phycisphaerales bacterium]
MQSTTFKPREVDTTLLPEGIPALRSARLWLCATIVWGMDLGRSGRGRTGWPPGRNFGSSAASAGAGGTKSLHDTVLISNVKWRSPQRLNVLRRRATQYQGDVRQSLREGAVRVGLCSPGPEMKPNGGAGGLTGAGGGLTADTGGLSAAGGEGTGASGAPGFPHPRDRREWDNRDSVPRAQQPQ